MTSANLVLTLSFVALTSCLTLAKPLSADSRQFLSLLSSQFLPLHSSTSYAGKMSSQEQSNDDGGVEMADMGFPDSSLESSAQEDLRMYPSVQEELNRQGLYSGFDQGRSNQLLNRMKDLYMAELLRQSTDSRSGSQDSPKWKRQPHLGFHASRG